jgi:predicted transcriptional regulator
MKNENLMKKWRTQMGLSQAEAAKALGYRSYTSISYFETNHRKVPTRTLLLMKSQIGANK